MADPIEYIQGAELPSIGIEWREPNLPNGNPGALHDFSVGWTFAVRVGQEGVAANFEKTTGIVGGPAVSPNVTINWDAGELDLPPGEYRFDVIGTNAGKQLVRSGVFTILPAVLPPA